MNTDHLFFGSGYKKESKEPINFKETDFFMLSPFSAHEIEIDGEVFKTVEHAYHSLRIKSGPEREEIKSQKSPMDAWRAGQKHKNNLTLRIEGFDKYELMEKLLRVKLKQHQDVVNVLLATEDRELLKVYDTDYDWGTGADGTGKNMYGKLWMKLRDELNK